MRLVQDQLTEERNTKASVEKRAVEVITTSGTLVTVLFALAALVTDSETFVLGAASKVALVLAVAAFLFAGASAVLVARPRPYEEVKVEDLRKAADPANWAASAAEAEPKIAAVLIKIICVAREANARKSVLLGRAVAAELVAISLVAVAVSAALWLS